MITRHPPLPSAFDVLVVAPSANPFLLTWGPPGDRIGRSAIAGSGYSQVVAPHTRPFQSGHSLHPGDQTENPQPVGVWHHVSIEPREAIVPVGTTINGLDASAVESHGNRASMLKARIKLAMGNARSRDFDFDVGAGVDFDVCCYAVLGIDALVPDPAGGGATPEDIVANPFALATIFTTAVYCGASKNHEKNPLTYTQSFLIDETGLTMPVMPAARDVIVYASAGTILQMVYIFDNPILPANDVPSPPASPFQLMSTVIVPVGQSHSAIVPIPGNVNAFVVNPVGGAAQVTIVQILNL